MKVTLLVVTSAAAIALASAAWADSNTVYLNQSGSDARALIDQGGGGGNAISLYQYNSHNAVDLLQDGANNKIGTNSGVQNGNGETSAQDQWATIRQHGAYGDVEFSQYGNSNGIGVTQSSDYDTATISQNGSNLTSYVNQYGGGGHTASITQSGSMNIIGHGYGMDSQTGSSQTLTAYQTGQYEYLDFYQGGSNNTITSNQWGAGTDLGSSLENYTTSGGYAVIYQNYSTGGYYNNVNNTQGAGSYLYAIQDGWYNTLKNVQDAGAYASIFQNGLGNKVDGNQSGFGQANVTQLNNYNAATYVQAGSGNFLTINQTSSYNSANVTQNGSNNSSTIKQH